MTTTTGPDEHGMSYAYLHGGQVHRTIEVGTTWHVDLDKDGRIVGVETMAADKDFRDALVLLAIDGQLVLTQ